MAATPATFDGGAVGLSADKDPFWKTQSADDLQVIATLQSYWHEADNARKGGLNPRDDKWRDNLNLYWNRFDWSKKAQWQAKETMPEVPNYVDRFAAAMKEALVANQDGFYNVIDPADKENDIAAGVKRMTDVWLTRVGRSQTGQLLPYSAVFEEQIKLGALMNMASVTTWKDDVPGGRVAEETVDPRFVWLDHTGRNMYRVRRLEIDRHELEKMRGQKDSKGQDLFKGQNMESLINSMTLYDQVYKGEQAGHGVNISSARSPVTLDEYIATVVDNQGKLVADRSLMVVANGKYLIRGPEANPFWHGQDWMSYTPLITSPLSVYGRTYMEDFGSMAKTFTELTNMLLDAVYTVSLKAWAIVPGMLLNPGQVGEGITPNKLFLLEDGYRAEDFAKALDLGNLPPESLNMWTQLKNELTEAANMNEVGLGQFAPKGRTSAEEIRSTQQNSSALIRSIAQTVETRWLDPKLDLVWKTGLQHVGTNHPMMARAVGEETFKMLVGRRKEFIKRPFTFQARGISNTIYKSQQLKSLLTIFQIVAGNPVLTQKFFELTSIDRFMMKLFQLSGVDITSLQATDRERLMAQVAQPLQQAQQNAQGAGQGGGQGGKEMQSLVNSMGVGNG